jgi:hypothetical protein
MVFIYLSPAWFYGYDIALEGLFTIVSFVVALFAFKIYKETSERSVKLFGTAFLLIAVSYTIQTVLNLFIFIRTSQSLNEFMHISSLHVIHNLGMITHILFMTIGLVVLAYMTFKICNSRVFWLLLVLALAGIFLSLTPLFSFYLFSSILLIFISGHFLKTFWRKKQPKTLLVAVAFLLLLFGSIHFFISENHRTLYAVGHILELCAYILIMVNLYLVRYHGAKTRKIRNHT